MTATSEKREFRWRSKCPREVKRRLVVATSMNFASCFHESQRVRVKPSSSTKPEWSFVIVGETGNQYKVVIGTVPTCTCPDYKKRSDHCKHTLFVLNKIVGLDKDDELMYQKAYLVDELTSMFELMDDKDEGESNGGDDDDDDDDDRLKNEELKELIAEIKEMEHMDGNRHGATDRFCFFSSFESVEGDDGGGDDHDDDDDDMTSSMD